MAGAKVLRWKCAWYVQGRQCGQSRVHKGTKIQGRATKAGRLWTALWATVHTLALPSVRAFEQSTGGTWVLNAWC